MRKTLSIILCVMMLLSVCSFAIPASAAPEGTAINTADEFMAMVSTPADATEVTAKYYLNADITLAGTYLEPFWGNLDGNGHTVTVSAPMFADFSGEVRNLKIKGEIIYQDANAAAFTVLSAKGLNVINCQNDANVTITGNAKWAAGFVADCERNEVPCVFINSVNNGDIYVDSTADEKMRGGGFGGIIDSAIFFNCVNNGDIYMKGNICIAGGLVSRVALHAATNTAEAYNCVNNGNIKVEDTYLNKNGEEKGTAGADAGGIFGYIGCKNQAGWYRVYGCTNNGNIDAPYRAAGMVGYTYGSGSSAFLEIQFCINTGDLTYGRDVLREGTDYYDWASPFVAYTNSEFTTIKFNIDTGSLIKRAGALTKNPGQSFVGCSGADSTMYDLQGNYILNYDQFMYYAYASSDDNAVNRHTIDETDGIVKTTLEDVKSGKVAYEIMQIAMSPDSYGFANIDVDTTTPYYHYYEEAGYPQGYEFSFYQKIGSDDYPSINSEQGWVVLSNGAYVNGDKTTPEVTTEEPKQDTEPQDTTPVDGTEAPVDGTDAPVEGGDATDAPVEGEQTTAPITEEKKGCGGFVAGSAIIVAILGTALIIKKRD